MFHLFINCALCITSVKWHACIVINFKNLVLNQSSLNSSNATPRKQTLFRINTNLRISYIFVAILIRIHKYISCILRKHFPPSRRYCQLCNTDMCRSENISASLESTYNFFFFVQRIISSSSFLIHQTDFT